jgi:hypothetical protein
MGAGFPAPGGSLPDSWRRADLSVVIGFGERIRDYGSSGDNAVSWGLFRVNGLKP